MTALKSYLNIRAAFRFTTAFLMFIGFTLSAYADEGAAAAKITPNIKLSYKIIDGKKTVRIEVSKKEGKKFTPIDNLIVNLYNGEVKKYDQVTALGWVGNQVTDEDGVCVFVLSDKFKKLTEGTHAYTFIASIGSNPEYEDTREEIVMTDAVINISSTKDDSLTTVVAKLSKYKDSSLAALPSTEMKLFVKRTLGMLPFGEEGLSTDDKGEVTATLPPDLPGNSDGSITVVARYEDQENDGIIEVSKNIPWNIMPKENKLTSRTLWSSGDNAPWPLVIVTVSLIALIWGTILYLISFLFKVKKLR